MPFYNHDAHYADLVIAQRPRAGVSALDVGCGDGRYTVRLPRAGVTRVVGLDLEQSVLPVENAAEIEWVADDFLGHDFGSDRFDFIMAMASIHHMSFLVAITKMRSLLNPGGTLAVLGLYRPTTLLDHLLDVPAFAANQFYGYTRATTPTPAPIRPPTMSLREIKLETQTHLGGASVRRLLLWRYLLTWTASPA